MSCGRFPGRVPGGHDVELGARAAPIPDTTDEFSVNVRGRGSFLGRLAGIRIRIDNQTINGRVYDFEASHQGDGVWRIDRIAGSTEAPGSLVADVSVENSTCAATRMSGAIVAVTMTGTVVARVAVSNVRVTGYANGAWVGSDSLGSIATGESADFSISGSVSTTASTIQCTVGIVGTRARAQGLRNLLGTALQVEIPNQSGGGSP